MIVENLFGARLKNFSVAMGDQVETIYLPGAASLPEQLDQRVLLVLRDGRNLIGTLRSFDQYMNLVIEDTIERVIYEGILLL